MGNIIVGPIGGGLPPPAHPQPVRWGEGGQTALPMLAGAIGRGKFTEPAPKKGKAAAPPIGAGCVVALHMGSGVHTVCEAIAACGADPVIVRTRDEAHETEFTHLVLLGGADISPAYYGQRVVNAYPTDKERDYLEWVLAHRAAEAGVPMLGICRGHQMLAVASGATLYQDVLKEDAATRDHARGNHHVRVSGPLAERIGKRPLVNSFHHQAVKFAPTGLNVAAESDDGLIEAFWKPGYVSVQWHPEFMDDGRQLAKLMNWLFEGLGK